MPAIRGSVDPDPALALIRQEIGAINAKIDILNTTATAILAKVNSAVIPPVTPPAPPPAIDWPPATQPPPGSTVTLTAGVKLGAYHFDNPVVIKGAGMRRTILDGQGGVDSGARLAWGKGIVHVRDSNIRIEDVGFRHAGTLGSGRGTSDGEAGVYAETSAGAASVTLSRCAFDGNENGVYVPSYADNAKLVDLTVSHCVFGRAGANGLNDGRSHDMYVGGKSVTIRNSVFAGNSRGNTIKVRGPHLLAEDNWIGRFFGRWLDFPGGTEAITRRNVFVSHGGGAHTGSNNAVGLFDEDDAFASPLPGSWLSEDDTFVFSRAREVIWNNRPLMFKVNFIRPKVCWVGPVGAIPPVVVYSSDAGGATLIDLPNNPFVLNESNRVNVLPVAPADPTAP